MTTKLGHIVRGSVHLGCNAWRFLFDCDHPKQDVINSCLFPYVCFVYVVEAINKYNKKSQYKYMSKFSSMLS